MNKNETSNADCLQRLVRRQWCVEKAIEWCKPGEDTTAEMIDSAALIERYVTTGEHSPTVAVAQVQSAMQETERTTNGVQACNARKVLENFSNRCGLPPMSHGANNSNHEHGC